jgi:hypothetical protein
MSHVAVGAPVINPAEFCVGGLDYEATKLALEALGGTLEVVLNQPNFQWVGKWFNDYHAQDAAYKHGIDPKDYGKCVHVIRFKRDAYEEERYAKNPASRPNEVGLVQLPNGMLAPIFDHFGSRGKELELLLGGSHAPKLTTLINQFKTTLQVAKQKGHYIKGIEKLGGDTRVKVIIGVKPAEKL